MKNLIKSRLLKPAMVLAALVVALTACDRLVYEDEGNCVVNYRLRFML